MNIQEFKSKLIKMRRENSEGLNQNELDQLVNKVVAKYRTWANHMIIMEELAELAQQVSKAERCMDNENHYELLEEMADVQIGLYMLQKIDGITDKELNDAIAIKLQRAANRQE